MKILLISDVESKYLWDFFNPEKFKDIELVISCGDLKAEYMSYLVTVIKKPLYYINGNHDGRYLTNPPEGCDCIDDLFLNFKGLRIIGLGGSKRYKEGPFQYTEREMKKRIKKLKWKLFKNKGFDILVTHAGAYGIGDDSDKCHEGFKSFVELLDKYSPKYFFHGHTHLNYNNQPRILQYKNTTVINAYGYHIIEV
jgi:uncharacterized protein